MNFYSVEFFYFSFITVVLYFLFPPRLGTVFLVLAGFFFYGQYSIAHALLLAASTAITYSICQVMSGKEDGRTKRKLLLLSLTYNIGILFIFKYFNFFNGIVASLATHAGVSYRIPALQMALPVGISFYTFLLLAYSIDVYRGSIIHERNIARFTLFVSFFPKILAGPIERGRDFLPQLQGPHKVDWQGVTWGIKLIVWGLFKKLVIADRLAAFVDPVFATPAEYTGLSLTIAALFYSFQIYADFSGYTDIAIGLSQIIGFRIADNFNRPYAAASVSEFWRRWHISLSAWLRDYLYIPLGGNRVSNLRRWFNVLIVFLLCGLWHGASWTFIVWGAIHGIYIVFGLASQNLRRWFASVTGLDRLPALHRGLRILITFVLVTIAWVFFRANSIHDGFYIVSHLFSNWSAVSDPAFLKKAIFMGHTAMQFSIALASLAFMIIVHYIERHETMRTMFAGKPLWLRWSFYYIFVTGILLLGSSGTEKFIYFQF